MTQSRTKLRVITNTVIQNLALAGALSAAIVAPNSLQLVDRYFKRRDRQNARHTLNYLKYRKLVEIKEKNGQQYYRLTKRGRDKYVKIQIDELSIPTPRKWDGKWRVIIFDIPEAYRNQRRSLLNKLKALDFYMLQQSTWVHPFDCEKQIGVLLDSLKLDKFVTYLVVEEGNFVGHAARYFKDKKLLV